MPDLEAGAIVQIHVTQACNLRCRHCYSESGPGKHSGHELSHLLAFLDWARQNGYSQLSVSGGEPFLYPQFRELLAHAKAAAWTTSTATNGTLLHREEAISALAYLDLIGVSVDGPPDVHNSLRGDKRAFVRSERGLATLRDHGKAFLIIQTLTRQTLPALDWTLDFALASGARGLRLHPLERLGFGAKMESEVLQPADLAAAYIWVYERRRHVPDGFRLEIDLANREAVRRSCSDSKPWRSEVINPLVIHPNGVILPFTYGMPPGWSLGDVNSPKARPEADEWPQKVKPLLERARLEAERLSWPFFNWFEHLVATAVQLEAEKERPVPRKGETGDSLEWN